MYTNNLLRIIEIYKELDRGCSRHRVYKAKRQSKHDCHRCRELWRLRGELKQLLEEVGAWNGE